VSRLYKEDGKPAVVKTDQTIFFDCDDTLIDWSPIHPDDDMKDFVTLMNGAVQTYTVKRMEANIRSLMIHKQMNHCIIVWSAAGYEHAYSVVEALGLMDYVDLICCKPAIFYDDLQASEFMNESKRRWRK